MAPYYTELCALLLQRLNDLEDLGGFTHSLCHLSECSESPLAYMNIVEPDRLHILHMPYFIDVCTTCKIM